MTSIQLLKISSVKFILFRIYRTNLGLFQKKTDKTSIFIVNSYLFFLRLFIKRIIILSIKKSILFYPFSIKAIKIEYDYDRFSVEFPLFAMF